MKIITEAGDTLHAFMEFSGAGAPLAGLEAAERLFAEERVTAGVRAAPAAPVGPELDSCAKPPTARSLARFVPKPAEVRELVRSHRLFGGALDVLTVDAYGAPSFGPLAPPEGIGFHTPENVDHTLAQAIAIARWQASAANVSRGSYMGILGYNGQAPMSDPLAWTMVRSVTWNVACGGISTKRTADVWAPQRFPRLAEFLSDAAYADPNRFLHQIAISGKAAWWQAKLSTAAGRDEVRGALIALARWIKVLEASYSYDAFLSLHRHWQLNRSDPAGLDFAELVFEEYAKLEAPAPVDVDPRITAKDARFDAAGVAVRALEQRVAADIKAIRAELLAGRQA